MQDIGIILQSNKKDAFKVYADTDFLGNLIKNYAKLDPATARPWSGWIITYANCPIIWASKLQMQIALSATEAEYISLSTALRDIIPLMLMIRELR